MGARCAEPRRDLKKASAIILDPWKSITNNQGRIFHDPRRVLCEGGRSVLENPRSREEQGESHAAGVLIFVGEEGRHACQGKRVAQPLPLGDCSPRERRNRSRRAISTIAPPIDIPFTLGVDWKSGDDIPSLFNEACQLQPEIAGPGTHPKVAQVLLERQMPDAALMVLRCSGHDGLSPFTNSNSVHEATPSVPLHVAVTAVVFELSGLLTQAFMYQRRHCSRLKEEQVQHKSASVSGKNLESNYYDCKHQMEILVTEMCFLCMRRNLVGRIIELPWNVDEEKCLRKCLLSSALEDLSSNSGSLLVVYYLHRCRYIEAYEVDWILMNLEESMISKRAHAYLVPDACTCPK
ncbi:E3 ubiquitin-protein ligase [Nymphaea thermarum]|nr:E3 ubiquitin-protein ligase [Nymphaea thermarum]